MRTLLLLLKVATMLSMLILTLTAPAFAQLRLSWDDCASGKLDNSFACNTNSALHWLVPSFIAPPGIESFVATTTEILVAAGTSGLPNWWQFAAGSCRTGALTIEDPSAVGFTGCANPFEGGACTSPGSSSACLFIVFYEPNYGGNPARAKFSGDMMRGGAGVPLIAGTEYMSTNFLIRSTKTIGADACAGCLEPICLTAQRVTLYETSGPTIEVTGDACATWQGGAINDPAGCCGAVPTRRETWGGVKSLYR